MTSPLRGFREMKSVVVRFAGDSGDGMQVVGERFTDTSVTVPNAIATFPDYPAEIRVFFEIANIFSMFYPCGLPLDKKAWPGAFPTVN